MSKYHVSLRFETSVEVDADSPEDARSKVLALAPSLRIEGAHPGSWRTGFAIPWPPDPDVV